MKLQLMYELISETINIYKYFYKLIIIFLK